RGAAARGLLALARARLRRGQVAAARSALDEAREAAQQADEEGLLLDVSWACGVSLVDAGALADAETALRAALAAARARHPHRVVSIGAALSRALFWQGRYDEALDLVRAVESGVREPGVGGPGVGELGVGEEDDHVALHAAAARAAVGARAADAGQAAAARAVAAAERLGRPGALARATCAAAFVHLAADDRAAVTRDVDRCIRAARAAHDRMRALRARLMLAEVQRRQGLTVPVLRLLGRLRWISRAGFPATVQGRVTLLRQLLERPGDHGVPGRVAAASGLVGLGAFAPCSGRTTMDSDRTARDILALLAATHEAGDELASLQALCAAVRQQLGAAAVACLVLRSGSTMTIASAGGRFESDDVAAAAGRMDSRFLTGTIGAPLLSAPVRYGGRSLGALLVRWTVGGHVAVEYSRTLVNVAAAVVAPVLASLSVGWPSEPPGTGDIVGASAAMQEVRCAIDRAARAPYPVLIAGESGSGKELVARALHRRSPRRDRPWCAVNCAALPDDLVEAELFGHARGAFTGAVLERQGVFEEAHGGTLFLDEVGELTPRAQAKLLRVLQEGEVRRLGENVSRRVDVRLVTATNRDLRAEVAAGRFRLDLLYRLDVLRIPLPPLRDRLDDVPALVERFWREAAGRVQSGAALAADTLATLCAYRWPGNVRELQNVLAALAVHAPRRGVVRPSALPPAIAGDRVPIDRSIGDVRRAADERCVREALARAGGHRGRAARALGLTRQGLAKLIVRLGIDADASAPCAPTGDAAEPFGGAAGAGGAGPVRRSGAL
ncbi:MAG: sigma 54-interacting transcriptional regulator, partial [Vicinamibacterales bacterium]